jgi:hypothetical protein
MRLALKPAGVGIVFQREDSDDHQGLVVREIIALCCCSWNKTFLTLPMT